MPIQKIYADKDYVNIKIDELSEEIAELKGDGTPHQMLVTDENGMVKWEERTHYENSNMCVLFDGQPVFQSFGKGSAMFIVGEDGENRIVLNPNALYTVIINGVEYNDLHPETWTFGFCLGDLFTGATLPFCISSYGDNSEQSATELYIPESYGDTCSFKLIETVKTVKTIDPKYLPKAFILDEGTTITTNLIFDEIVEAVQTANAPEVTVYTKIGNYIVGARRVTAIDALSTDGTVSVVNLIVNQGEMVFLLSPDGTIVKE